TGGGVRPARAAVADTRLKIVADGRRVLELAATTVAGRDQHVVALVDAVQNIGDAFAHALGRDAVRLIEFLLLVAPAVGLRHRALHRPGHLIGIENQPAVDVARRA